MHIFVKLVSGETFEKTIESETCVIGRSSKCDITVDSEDLSRQHCKIQLIDEEFYIWDLGSANGVFIDNKRLTPNIPTKYSNIFLLSLGPGHTVSVSVHSPPKIMIADQATNKELINRKAIRQHNSAKTKADQKDSFFQVHIINMILSVLLFATAIYYSLNPDLLFNWP